MSAELRLGWVERRAVTPGHRTDMISDHCSRHLVLITVSSYIYIVLLQLTWDTGAIILAGVWLSQWHLSHQTRHCHCTGVVLTMSQVSWRTVLLRSLITQLIMMASTTCSDLTPCHYPTLIDQHMITTQESLQSVATKHCSLRKIINLSLNKHQSSTVRRQSCRLLWVQTVEWWWQYLGCDKRPVWVVFKYSYHLVSSQLFSSIWSQPLETVDQECSVQLFCLDTLWTQAGGTFDLWHWVSQQLFDLHNTVVSGQCPVERDYWHLVEQSNYSVQRQIYNCLWSASFPSYLLCLW